jgi:hypothetical protein
LAATVTQALPLAAGELIQGLGAPEWFVVHDAAYNGIMSGMAWTNRRRFRTLDIQSLSGY